MIVATGTPRARNCSGASTTTRSRSALRAAPSTRSIATSRSVGTLDHDAQRQREARRRRLLILVEVRLVAPALQRMHEVRRHLRGRLHDLHGADFAGLV